MPRSSRHRSRRSRRHSRDQSVSDVEEEGPRDRKPREEEPAASSGARVLRDLEPDKRRSPPAPEGEEALVDVENEDVSREQARKRKERAEEVADAIRWSDSKVDKKRTKGDDFGTPQMDKASKSKHAAADSKGRSSRRRQDCPDERIEENVVKVDSAKRNQEKESCRVESGIGQYKGVKERDKEWVSLERDKERGLEREKARGSDRERDMDRDIHGIDRQRSDNRLRKKRTSKAVSNEEGNESRKDIKFNEVHSHDMIPNPEFEKGLEKRMRRVDSEEKDRGTDVRRLSSINDDSKSRSYRDGRHGDGKCKDKTQANLGRDKGYRDDKHHGEHSSRDRVSDRYLSNEIKLIDSRYRKSKQDRDDDGGPYPNDCDDKSKDDMGIKRSSYENENHSESRPPILKDIHEHVEKNVIAASRNEFRTDKPKLESTSTNHQKGSSSSTVNVVKDHMRYSSKQAKSIKKGSPSEERYSTSVASSGRSGTRSDKVKLKAEIGEHYMETSATIRNERATRLDARTSAIQRRERSPSSNSDQRFSERTAARRSFDTEITGQRSNNFKGGDQGHFPSEKAVLDAAFQTQMCNRESKPAESSTNQIGQLSDCSPSLLPPLPSMRLGTDSPSVLGLYENDDRSQIVRKSYNRYNRTNDLGFVRDHVDAWKNAPPWPSPMGNAFIPLQHGAPSAGFHPPVHFQGPPFFGVGSPMDFAHGGISYHMHDMANSFHGHGRPYAWHNAVDQQCPRQMLAWGGSNSAFGDESHMYGRSGWNQNRHLPNTRGWEMGADMWKGQNGNINVDSVPSEKITEESGNPPVDEIQVAQLGPQSRNEMKQSEILLTERTEEKRSSDSDLSKDIESSQKPSTKKSTEVPIASGNGSNDFGVNYLSKIDISPILADSELFKKCTTLLGMIHIDHEFASISHGHLQKNKYNNSGKCDITREILKSLFSTAKDNIFQRAISLYKKQNKSSILKLPTTPLFSSTDKNEPLLVSDKGKMEEARQQASLEKPSLPEHGPAGSNESDHFTAVSVEVSTGYPMKADVGDSDLHCDTDTLICADDNPARESLMEVCRMNLSQIPNSPESTR